jgi:hypothetical protein
MLHLEPERLASLADDEATAEEAEHLACCAACSWERDSYRTLLAMAASAGSNRDAEPISDWSAIAQELEEEGRIRRSPIGSRRAAWWLQAAAAVLLVVAGAVGGYWGAATTGDVGETSRLATMHDDSTFASEAEARRVLERAQRQYLLASAYLAAQNEGGLEVSDPDFYRARLAALDAMAGVAREAVYEAPSDPVLSEYYLTTEAARQLTLNQLSRSLPQGTRLTSF